MRVLYVCPLAYYSGHPPWAAKYEPKALKDAGHDVTLLTYCGLMKGMRAEVKQVVVSRDNKLQRWLRKYTAIRLPFMTYEVVRTINKALKLRKNYDVLYLRDGEPGIFLVHLLSLKYKDVKWAVSMMGSVVCAPKEKRESIKRWHLDWYTKGIEFFNGTLWHDLYVRSLKKNKFVLITQNDLITRAYDNWQNGVFKGRVFTQAMGTLPTNGKMDKFTARKVMRLPYHRFVILCFGAPHPGKDIEVVYKAAQYLQNVYVLYAGIAKFSIGDEPRKLVDRYGLQGRSLILDYYVSEEEKTRIFSAVDACVLSYTKEFKATTSVLWDACKYKVPVIASSANTLGELVRQYKVGVEFENSDEHSLVTAIKEARELDLKAVGQNCEAFVDAFSLSAWAKGVTKIVEEHLG